MPEKKKKKHLGRHPLGSYTVLYDSLPETGKACLFTAGVYIILGS